MLCIKLHPLKSKMHPPLNRSCTPSEPKLHPLTRFLSKLESFAIFSTLIYMGVEFFMYGSTKRIKIIPHFAVTNSTALTPS